MESASASRKTPLKKAPEEQALIRLITRSYQNHTDKFRAMEGKGEIGILIVDGSIER
jgi:hypothetical protein